MDYTEYSTLVEHNSIKIYIDGSKTDAAVLPMCLRRMLMWDVLFCYRGSKMGADVGYAAVLAMGLRRMLM